MKKIPFSQFADNKYKKILTIPAGSSINTFISGVKLISVHVEHITGTGVLVFSNVTGLLQILNSNYVPTVYGVNTQEGTVLSIYRDPLGVFIRNNSEAVVYVTVKLYDI
jgi:hypothetical protein